MRARHLLVTALAAAAAASGCSSDGRTLSRPSRPFCEAAHRYDVRVEQQASLDEQIRLVQRMVDHAPKDIASDTATFLHALERRRDGDRSVVDDPEIEQAVRNVNRRAANGCGFYRQSSGL